MKIPDLVARCLEDARARKTLTDTSLKNYRCRLKLFRTWMGEEAELSELTTPKLKRYLIYLQTEILSGGGGKSPRSIHSHWVGVKYFCNWLVEFGHLEDNPIPAHVKLPKLPVPIRHRASPEIVQALLAATDQLPKMEGIRARCVLYILCTTAVRRAELANIRIQDVSLSDRTLHVEYGKGNKSRTLYLPGDAIEAIERWLEVRKSALDWLLTSKISNRRFGERALYDLLIDLAQRAGVPDYRDALPHAMRRGTATRLLQAGYDIRAVQEVLGHSSLSITEMYVSAGGERLKQLAHLSSLSRNVTPLELPAAIESGTLQKFASPVPEAVAVPMELPYALPELSPNIMKIDLPAAIKPEAIVAAEPQKVIRLRVPLWQQPDLITVIERAQKGAAQ